MELKKGNTVLILTGKDRGKQGTIEKVLRKEQKVVVGGLNIAKRHLKPSRQYPSGGIIEIPQPLNQSKVKVITDETPASPAKKAETKGKK